MAPPAAHPEAIIEMTRQDLEDIIEGAAKRGAERALQEVGLTEKAAVDDVKELRSLLGTWRSLRETMLKTIVQAITMGILGAIALGLAIKFGVTGSSGKP